MNFETTSLNEVSIYAAELLSFSLIMLGDSEPGQLHCRITVTMVIS